MSKVAVHLTVEGRVQGVGFRYFSQRLALNNELTGYVKNLVDGNVEIVAEGENQNLDNFILSLYRDHPYAKIANLTKKEIPISGKYENFHIKY